MVKRCFILGLLVLAVSSIAAEDNRSESVLKNFLDKALQLNLVLRVLPPDHQPVWNVKSSKVTIPGRSVSIKLVGENILIDIVLTPYKEENGIWFLVAQGQVWLSEVAEKQTRYRTTFKSFPVSLGEKIMFYPLGSPDDITEQKCFNIELEIQVSPYKNLLENSLN